MPLWLCRCICIYLYISISIFLCLVVTLLPHFHCDYLAPSVTYLSKRLTMYAHVFIHKHCELPTSSLLQLVGAPLYRTGADFSFAQQPVAPLKLRNRTTSNTCAGGALDFNNYENIVSDFYHFWKFTAIGEVGRGEGGGGWRDKMG